MKRIFLSLLAISVIACKKEVKEEKEAPKDYVTFSGKIDNSNDKKLITIMNRDGFEKKINLNADGTFADTLKVAEGKYMFTDGNEYGQIYLKNGDEVNLTLDTKEFDETIKFEGGNEINNFYVAASLLQEKYMSDEALSMDKEGFNAHMEKLKTDFNELKSKYPNSAELLERETKGFEAGIIGMGKYHDEKLAIKEEFPAGTPSPKFAYNDINGKTVSLDDLKGKFVYIDLWATWCGPCKVEIPHLKEVEKKYHDKNIEFVSISIDQMKDEAKWKAMVQEKELGGIQLMADKDWKSDFPVAYKVTGIPRFILLDTKGNIVDPDAPRPSSPKLIELFEANSI